MEYVYMLMSMDYLVVMSSRVVEVDRRGRLRTASDSSRFRPCKPLTCLITLHGMGLIFEIRPP